ncbi:MAG: hypothetical protein V4606_00440 [Patescibacteria group bacterium]
MSESLKNILVGIICVVLFGFAYFFFTGSDPEDGFSTQSADEQAALVAKTQSFIERSRVLEAISIDAGFFTNSVFTSLRSFSTEVPNQPLGKNNIFDTAQNVTAVATEAEEDAE